MSEYHLQIEITLACGCQFEQRIDQEMIDSYVDHRLGGVLPDVLAEQIRKQVTLPGAEVSMLGLLLTLQREDVMQEVVDRSHIEEGGEAFDIKVRTKIGPIPPIEEWPSNQQRGDDHDH